MAQMASSQDTITTITTITSLTTIHYYYYYESLLLLLILLLLFLLLLNKVSALPGLCRRRRQPHRARGSGRPADRNREGTGETSTTTPHGKTPHD